MSDLATIPFSPANTDMAALHFTQSKTGHVHSPWFTFDWTKDAVDGRPFHGFHNQTRLIIQAAVTAFSDVLKVDRESVIVTMKEDHATIETVWRLGTCNPCELPNPPKPRVTMAQGDEIEIEVTPARRALK